MPKATNTSYFATELLCLKDFPKISTNVHSGQSRPKNSENSSFIFGTVSLGGSPVRTVGAMTLQAFGCTRALFLASLSAGIAVASRRVLAHAEFVCRIAAVAPVVIGLDTFADGLSQL
ncbi:MAG TPA: hypothetical protein VFE81_04930 [Paraburkholderia sp.]|nr:hypothetical protein [Paraburkholderia sp.]